MTSKLSISSSVSSATLVAINSISAATVAADYKQNHHAAVATDDPLKDATVEEDELTSALDDAEREDRLFTPKSSTAAMKPDVGILSKDFLKNKGQEQPVDKQFAIHRKKRAAADVDVDVGILDNRRWHESRANLHDKNEVLGRSLQSSDYERFDMCPGKNHQPGWLYFPNLFNQTDHFFFREEGYFPKCRCPSPTSCGPVLCECLELDADGDILQCMDPLKQLCEGTMYIEGIPGPWSMEECLLGNKRRAINYCSILPCFVDGGSYMQCKCEWEEKYCTEFRDARSCATSKCCQAQTDEEGRKACFNGGYENYIDQVTSFSISDEEMVSRFSECAFNSENDKTTLQCYCESFSYGMCVNYGVRSPDLCEAMNCCYEQTEDDTRLDCFSRFRDGGTGSHLAWNRDTIYESCVASGKPTDQCKCDIYGLTNCVYGVNFYQGIDFYTREPRCDLFQCCQSQTLDEGRKDCLVQDEAQLMYDRCIINGNTAESCYCDKSTTLCTAGHSNGRHYELSSCCQEQTDDIGRKECIGNFTTSQPSSAPSETTPSPTATSISPGTSSASIPTPLGAKSHAKTTSKMLAVTAAVIGWLLFS